MLHFLNFFVITVFKSSINRIKFHRCFKGGSRRTKWARMSTNKLLEWILTAVVFALIEATCSFVFVRTLDWSRFSSQPLREYSQQRLKLLILNTQHGEFRERRYRRRCYYTMDHSTSLFLVSANARSIIPITPRCNKVKKDAGVLASVLLSASV